MTRPGSEDAKPGLLLDTNVLLWILLGDDRKISKRAHGAISKPGTRLFVSVVSIWEILLKRHAGKLLTTERPEAIVTLIQSQTAWRVLPLEPAHLHALAEIADFNDHTDPFYRLLIAQTISEKLGIVTADPKFPRYKVNVVW